MNKRILHHLSNKIHYLSQTYYKVSSDEHFTGNDDSYCANSNSYLNCGSKWIPILSNNHALISENYSRKFNSFQESSECETSSISIKFAPIKGTETHGIANINSTNKKKKRKRLEISNTTPVRNSSHEFYNFKDNKKFVNINKTKINLEEKRKHKILRNLISVKRLSELIKRVKFVALKVCRNSSLVKKSSILSVNKKRDDNGGSDKNKKVKLKVDKNLSYFPHEGNFSNIVVKPSKLELLNKIIDQNNSQAFETKNNYDRNVKKPLKKSNNIIDVQKNDIKRNRISKKKAFQREIDKAINDAIQTSQVFNNINQIKSPEYLMNKNPMSPCSPLKCTLSPFHTCSAHVLQENLIPSACGVTSPTLANLSALVPAYVCRFCGLVRNRYEGEISTGFGCQICSSLPSMTKLDNSKSDKLDKLKFPNQGCLSCGRKDDKISIQTPDIISKSEEDKLIKKPTKKESEKPTKNETEKTSNKETEKPTKKETEKPAKKETEKPTKKETKKPTKKETENVIISNRAPSRSIKELAGSTKVPYQKPQKELAKQNNTLPDNYPTLQPVYNSIVSPAKDENISLPVATQFEVPQLPIKQKNASIPKPHSPRKPRTTKLVDFPVHNPGDWNLTPNLPYRNPNYHLTSPYKENDVINKGFATLTIRCITPVSVNVRPLNDKYHKYSRTEPGNCVTSVKTNENDIVHNINHSNKVGILLKSAMNSLKKREVPNCAQTRSRCGSRDCSSCCHSPCSSNSLCHSECYSSSLCHSECSSSSLCHSDCSSSSLCHSECYSSSSL